MKIAVLDYGGTIYRPLTLDEVCDVAFPVVRAPGNPTEKDEVILGEFPVCVRYLNEHRLFHYASAIPRALTSNWVIVIDATEPIHRVASSDAAPEDDGTIPANIGITSARVLNPEREEWIPESWALLDSALAAAPLAGTDMVIVIGRVGGPDYTASEVEHLGNLATILGTFLK